MKNIHLFSNEGMPKAATYAFSGGKAEVYSNKSPTKTGPNEDVAALIPYDKASGILAVADGLGGLPGGEEAARSAIEALEHSLQQRVIEKGSLRSAILNGIEEAHRTLLRCGRGGGTTLAVAELQKRSFRPYHVGDSMIYLIDSTGSVKFQTMPHSPLGYAIQAGLLSEKEAMRHPERHIVSNAIGFPGMKIEIGPEIEIGKGDTLLLTTDGMVDNLFIHEIGEIVRERSLAKMAQKLAEESRARMLGQCPGKPSKPDDLTFIAFRFENA